MPVYVRKLIEVLAELCEEKNLKAAVSESLKGGVLTGSSAVLGGLVLGPLGLALGGAFGGLVAAVSAKGKFKPVAEILKSMSPAQQQSLYLKIKGAFSDFGYEDVMNLAMLIVSTANLKELALKEVVNFLNKEMNLRIMP